MKHTFPNSSLPQPNTTSTSTLLSPFIGCHVMATSSSGSSIAISGFFSAAIQAETLRIAGTTYWACSTRAPDICHVVPHHDPQLKSPALFKFMYGSKLGCLPSTIKTPKTQFPLCGSCHTELDMSLDPGYVFFPTDLQYFIDLERRDRARREQIATDTVVPLSALSRQVPTSADYKQHEIDLNQISPTAIGGRYNRVFLKQFLHNSQIPGIEKPSQLQKNGTVLPLRLFVVRLPPLQVRVSLSSLMPVLATCLKNYGSYTSVTTAFHLNKSLYVICIGHKSRQLEDQTNDESECYNKRAKYQDTGFAGSASAVNQCHEDTDWVLGPQSTTNDVVKLYGPVFSSS
ncbi:uncharacterized protein N7500_000930 [Penicillium coprophilum]|uniref:uncharacterized protein n=1 Tax=Penicillium coprophilum TaxID=36646 RepID=UPI002385C080|nr:uncharacterized protein N7500_000930 [Penicillium coprophilum]KAJ5178231.1 hypothetical protein N7500_000930 [Penicillium coprophilum]